MEIPSLSKNRTFWIFWAGQSLSRVGDRLHYIAMMWYVVNHGDSAMDMGSILMASSLPVVILAPKAGEMTDRLNRKLILIVADLLRAFAALGMGIASASHKLDFTLLLIFAVIMAIGNAFFQPAVHTLVPLMVQKKDLLRANSLNEGSAQVCGMAGPVLAGVILSFFSPGIVFYMNAVSFIIAAVSAVPIFVKPDYEHRTKHKFREGLNILIRQPAIRDIAVTFAVLNFAVSFMEVYIPFLNKNELNGGSKELGMIFGAIFAGAFAASVGLIVKKDISRWEKVIGAGIGIVGLSFAAIFFFRDFLPVLGCFLFIGLGWGIFSTNSRVFVQKTVEDQHRGKVFAIIAAISNLMMPLAYGLAGYSARLIPAYTAFLMGGLMVFVCGIYIFCRRFQYVECECQTSAP